MKERFGKTQLKKTIEQQNHIEKRKHREIRRKK